VAFDLDGTLVVDRSSWAIIHEYFGTTQHGLRYLREYVEGKISYVEFMRRDIAAWPKPLHIDTIAEILNDYKLREGAERAVGEIRKIGLETAIVSAGIEVLALEVARKIGIDHVIANTLETDGEGYLTGEGVGRVDPLRKHEALLKLVDELGVELENVVAVGDTMYDVSFLEHAGIGVAMGEDLKLRRVADYRIDSIEDLPKLITELTEKTKST
jgi:phosphoserine phosphatase